MTMIVFDYPDIRSRMQGEDDFVPKKVEAPDETLQFVGILSTKTGLIKYATPKKVELAAPGPGLFGMKEFYDECARIDGVVTAAVDPMDAGVWNAAAEPEALFRDNLDIRPVWAGDLAHPPGSDRVEFHSLQADGTLRITPKSELGK